MCVACVLASAFLAVEKLTAQPNDSLIPPAIVHLEVRIDRLVSALDRLT